MVGIPSLLICWAISGMFSTSIASTTAILFGVEYEKHSRSFMTEDCDPHYGWDEDAGKMFCRDGKKIFFCVREIFFFHIEVIF